MDKRKREIAALVTRLTDHSAELEKNSVEKRKFRSKVINLFEKDLNENEKHLVVEYLLEELSYKTMVEHPEFLTKQINAKMKHWLFGGVVIFIIVITIAIFFSEASWVVALNSKFTSLLYKMGIN